MPHNTTAQTILIVEDNDDDFEASARALTRSVKFSNPIDRCRDGLEAWEYLSGTGRFAPPNHREKPGLVLLDLNMPGLDGRKLLSRLKASDALRKIPVVVMTTSAEPEDVQLCYDAGANTYICKPISWSEFCNAIARLQEYWLRIAILPE